MTKELAKEIENSIEMTTLKSMEIEIHKQDSTMTLLERYFTLKRDLEFEKAKQSDKDVDRLQRVLDYYNSEIEKDPIATQFMKAQMDFDKLMSTVNHILKFTISGECGNCSKCSHEHN